MERYEFQSGDTAIVHATTAESQSPSVVMMISYQAHIRDNAICGGPGENDVRTATFQVDGRQATEAETIQLRSQFEQRLPLIAAEGEQCVRFSQFDNSTVAQVTMRGIYNPVLDAPIAWVSPEAGFSAGQ